jgi:hypothetical protein
MSMLKPIPRGLLSALAELWKEPKGHCAFEAAFEGCRRNDPSYYLHRADGSDHRVSDFTYDEIADLSRAGILDGLHEDHGTGIAVNEHAEHALADFCRETYEAWRRCQERLAGARAAARHPSRGLD